MGILSPRSFIPMGGVDYEWFTVNFFEQIHYTIKTVLLFIFIIMRVILYGMGLTLSIV